MPRELLAGASELLAARIGLHFPEERFPDLERGLRSAARELGFADPHSCVRSLMASALGRPQVETLAACLTVGETYFFRERASFACLEQDILPDLIRAKRAPGRRLRIWSAGCSSGEEPYSIAMLLARLLPDLADWHVLILATDINARALERAARGLYGEWSFRDAPAGIRETFFTRTAEGRLALAPRIRSMVEFAYLNLAEDAYPSVETGTNAMDVVFCRNVVMYFEPAQARRVLERLGRALVEGGWLFVSPVEIPQVALPQLERVELPGAIAYRKASAAAPELVVRKTRWPSVPGAFELPQPAAPAPEASLPLVDLGVPVQPAHAEASPQTPLQQALRLYKRGAYGEAAEALRGLLADGPQDPEAMALLARACANQGRLAEALRWCERAVAADKLNPGRHYLQAIVLQELGEAAAAAAALRRALYLDQDHALAHFALGTLMRRQGERGACERHFRNALSILNGYPQEQLLPESEGITAGRLAQIVRSAAASEAGA
jgi:chemotaxis protein methyltransferase CheR